MTRHPKISIVMPVYNCERYVKRAIESILGQTFRDFEFIIVNDGSSDQTLEILKRFEYDDPRIRIITRENRGLVASLNEGVACSQGEFIARMDGDDIALPERLKLQFNRMVGDKSLVLLGTRIVLVDEEGRPLMRWKHKYQHEDIVPRLLNGDGSALTHPAVMMRRHAFDAVGGYDSRYGANEDLDLFLKLSEIGRIANLEQVLLLWRQHSGSINANMAELQHEFRILAVKEALFRRGADGFVTALMPSVTPSLQSRGPGFWADEAFRNKYYKTAIHYSRNLIFIPGSRLNGIRKIARCLKGLLQVLPRSCARKIFKHRQSDVRVDRHIVGG